VSGVDYLLDAQHDDGGWPQFYPIRKGYSEHITYNDGVKRRIGYRYLGKLASRLLNEEFPAWQARIGKRLRAPCIDHRTRK